MGLCATKESVPESLVPTGVRCVSEVEYAETGTYESRGTKALHMQHQVQDYFGTGIRFKEGMTVLDCGANIGVFALEVLHRLDGDARIYCFEPIPSTCTMLRLNLQRYEDSDHPPAVFNCGLGEKSCFVTFDHHPDSSTMSTCKPESYVTLDSDKLAGVLNSGQMDEVYTRDSPINPQYIPKPILSYFAKDWIDKAAVTEKVGCEIRTLREVIASHGIGDDGVIDLMKVDVEGAEEDVLLGLSAADWKKIQATVLEVHDIDGRLKRIAELCKENGLTFQNTIQETQFKAMGIEVYTLTAARYELVPDEKAEESGEE